MRVTATGEQSTNTNPKWVNLALAALLIYYVVLVASDLVWKNFCGNLALDYCSFWSAGYIANHVGYAKVYDLDQLEQVQRGLFPPNADPTLFATVPTPFLPVYVLPLQFVAFLKPFLGFGVWSLLNIVGFIGYLVWWFRKLSNRAIPVSLLFMFLLSLPVFLDLFWGQVNLWLMICIGEYIRGLMDKKQIRAGLWLGGLFLKPQLLILIVPALLFQRSFKMLFGFVINATTTLLVSLSLAGFDGLWRLVQLWIGYVSGLPSNDPQTMMNWRMVALALNNFMPSTFGWAIAVLGILITIAVTFSLWRVPVAVDSPNFSIVHLGLFVATGTIDWHSHFSTSMILIPLFLLAYIYGVFPEKLFLFWMFFPVVVRFAVLLLWSLIQASVISDRFTQLSNFAFGFSGLILNIAILIWSYQMIVRHRGMQLANESL